MALQVLGLWGPHARGCWSWASPGFGVPLRPSSLVATRGTEPALFGTSAKPELVVSYVGKVGARRGCGRGGFRPGSCCLARIHPASATGPSPSSGQSGECCALLGGWSRHHPGRPVQAVATSFGTSWEPVPPWPARTGPNAGALATSPGLQRPPLPRLRPARLALCSPTQGLPPPQRPVLAGRAGGQPDPHSPAVLGPGRSAPRLQTATVCLRPRGAGQSAEHQLPHGKPVRYPPSQPAPGAEWGLGTHWGTDE